MKDKKAITICNFVTFSLKITLQEVFHVRVVTLWDYPLK